MIIVVSPLPPLCRYMLVRDYCVTVEGVAVTVPSGFAYDGASIPGAFWTLLFSPYDPRVMEAALLHDYLYRTHVVDRLCADRVLVAMLRANLAPVWKVRLMFAAVRAFGGKRWRERNCGENNDE